MIANTGLRGFLLVPAAALAFAGCTADENPSEDIQTQSLSLQSITLKDVVSFQNDPVDAARQYLVDRSATLGLSDHADFALDKVVQRGDWRHVRLDQTHRGIKVWASQAVVSMENNTIRIAHSRLVSGLGDFDAAIWFSDADAMALAKADYAQNGLAQTGLVYQHEAVELVIYMKDKRPYTAWHTHFFVDAQDGMAPGRWHYFIDAATGHVLDRFDWLTTAPSQASGPGGNANVARTWTAALDVELTGMPGVYIQDTTTDADIGLPTVHGLITENWMMGTNPGAAQTVTGPLDPIGDAALNDAHGFTEQVLNFMWEWYSYDSIDGSGYAIRSRVHYDFQYENAFWDGTQMTYGDGQTYFYPLTGDIDVIGHEINHGFTENHSNLIYNADQSGGLNESFSDVAGTLASFYSNGNNGEFLIGADIATAALPGGALRFMCNPPTDGNSIGHFSDFSPGIDNHYTSGISNKAFCRAAKRLSGVDGGGDPDGDGGTGDIELGGATQAGVRKAGEAWYYGNGNLWSASETFAGACDKMYNAVSSGMVPGWSPNEIQALVDSWLDVGVPCGGQTPPPPPLVCDAVWTTDTGVITSPNWPSNYPNDWIFTDCIQPASGNIPTLSFTDFNTEAGYDFVTVRDGVTGVDFGIYSGTALPPDATAPIIVVKFTSDFSVTRPGWRAIWGSTGGNQAPTADFSFVATDLSVVFTDLSTDPDGIVVAWNWDFGDGNTSTAQNPSHTYAAGGTYTVSLTVTDDVGGFGTATQSVTVVSPNTPPTASFTYVATDLNVAFTDTSTDADGSIVSWSWNFGDGNTSTAQNPAHTYAAGGTYTVGLTVTDDAGDSSATSQTLTVVAPNIPPTASFSYVAANLMVTFTDSSTDADGSVVSWSWSFGDGNTSTAQNPVHTYAMAGTYTVTLVVTDDTGDSDAASQTLSVVEANIGPMASFSYMATDLVVNFMDTSVDPDGSIVAWTWNFGDGNSSNAQNPTHVYASGGTYVVTLLVTDDRGASAVASQSITVLDPNVAPTASFTHVATNLSVAFTDTSMDADGSIVSWSWNFGDGNGSSSQSPTYNYGVAGTYTVSLTVTDDRGGSDTAMATVIVVEANGLPTASFTHVATDLDVAFTDTSTDADGSIVLWAWDFGDGNTDSVQNPAHTYAAGGTYTVSLTVTDDRGDTDTATANVVVTAPNGLPTASFTYAANELMVTFTDTSSDGDGTIVSWAWDFGDSATDSVQNPAHTYAADGTYTVTLTVTDDRGDTATASQSVTIMRNNLEPVADFMYADTALTVAFTDASSDPDGAIVAWAWDFGDGGTDATQNPTHTYAADGTYAVTLTVTDDSGATMSATQSVIVAAGSTEDPGGCCDANGQRDTPWAAFIVLFGLVLMRRRQRLTAA